MSQFRRLTCNLMFCCPSGSLDSSDWMTAADRLDALKQSKTYNTLKNSIEKKKIKELYSAADEITADLRLGYLPETFFENSKLEVKDLISS